MTKLDAPNPVLRIFDEAKARVFVTIQSPRGGHESNHTALGIDAARRS